MIALALPWVFGAAVVGAGIVGALHLLSVQRPPELLFPTARFLPERTVRAVSRTRRPSDLLLMALRMMGVLAAGLAAAGPTWRSARASRVVLVVVDGAVARDTAVMQATIGGGNFVFAYVGDDSGGLVTAERDRWLPRATDVSAVWPTAWRAATALAVAQPDVDSIDLHLFISRRVPAANDGWTAWRATWPGRVIVHAPVVATRDSQSKVERRTVVLITDQSQRVTQRVDDTVDDVVVTAMQWHAARLAGSANARAAGRATGALSSENARVDTVRLMRTDDDLDSSVDRSADVLATVPPTELTQHTVRVVWPISGVPTGWVHATSRDSSTALVAGGNAMVGSWKITALPEETQVSQFGRDVDLAWWSDGTVAARERRTRNGCERVVAVVPQPTSDVLFSASANRLFDRLLAPCASWPVRTVESLGVIDTSGVGQAPTVQFREMSSSEKLSGATVKNGTPFSPSRSVLVPILLALALVMLVAESVVRTQTHTEGVAS